MGQWRGLRSRNDGDWDFEVEADNDPTSVAYYVIRAEDGPTLAAALGVGFTVKAVVSAWASKADKSMQWLEDCGVQPWFGGVWTPWDDIQLTQASFGLSNG